MDSNLVQKRYPEHTNTTPSDPTKKKRLSNGISKILSPHNSQKSDLFDMVLDSKINELLIQRSKFNSNQKTNENSNFPSKSSQKFKARPMPSFKNPFVPQHYKTVSTSFQEFNLSCTSKDIRKNSVFEFEEILKDENKAVKKLNLVGSRLPTISGSLLNKSLSANDPCSKDLRKSDHQIFVEVIEENMDID